MNWKRTVLFAVLTGAWTSLLQAALPKPGPEIFSLAPNEGPIGQEIELKGSGLAETRHVLFCVGTTIREASFKIVSDAELKAIAPTFLRPDAAATVVVQTTTGVTVGMPPSALTVDKIATRESATFYHVKKNGVLTSPSGITFVEDGGAAEAPTGTGLCFVRNGGSLLKLDHFQGMIFHEPLAQGCIDTRRSPHYPIMFVASNQVTASIGIERFLYDPPEYADAPPTTAPKVTSVTPVKALPGSLIMLHGHGFLGTSQIHVINRTSVSTVGFRIVSDNQLEIELSNRTIGFPLLVVVNPKGATVVLSQTHLMGRQVSGRPFLESVQVVRPREVFTRGAGSQTFLVETGGVIANTGGSCTFFVKKGGRMSLNGGAGGLTVFCEDEGDIEKDNQRGGGNTVRQVGPLSLSVLKAPIEIGFR